MPSKSKSQQRLFGMALAVRKGELKRSEVGKEVLDIVDGEMTDRQIEDFAKKRTSDRERVSEDLMGTANSEATIPSNSITDNGFHPMDNAGSVAYKHLGEKTEKTGESPLSKYMKNLKYAGGMKPIISVKPNQQYIFTVVKPGFSKLAQTVIERFENSGFKLYKTRTKMLSKREAKLLYKVHEKEDFYEALCDYMSGDFSIGVLFVYPSNWTSEQAFEKTAELKDDIRKEFQESDMRNVLHSSDNTTNMRVEMSMYFNELI